MSRKLIIYFFFTAYCLLFTVKLNAQDIPAKPNPFRLVNDFVTKLSPSELQSLEQKLKGYSDTTSTQIAIVIVKTTGDSDPYDYAMKIAKDWGVGQKDKNNGLLLLWATETRKLRIVTGRGMEATITDAVSKRIINTILTPYFKKGQFYQGLDEATFEIMKRASGEFEAEPAEGGGSVIVSFIALLIFLIFLYMIYRIIVAIIYGIKGVAINNAKNSGEGGFLGGGSAGSIIFSSSGSSSSGGGSSSSDDSSDDSNDDSSDFGGGDFGGGGAGGDY